MKMTEFFSAQLEREAIVTRRALERVPEGRADYKPHEKSMPLGYLATLVGTMPGWIGMMLTQDELDLNPPGGSGKRPPAPTTTEEHLSTPWRLLVAGRVVMESPRHVVIADTFMHLAHHRGQLTVYLRLND